MRGLQLVAPHELRVVALPEPPAEGRAIVEVDRVKPLDAGSGWHWVFSFQPGF